MRRPSDCHMSLRFSVDTVSEFIDHNKFTYHHKFLGYVYEF